MMTPLDPLISSLAQKLANTALDILHESGKKLLKSYIDKNLIDKASKEYAKKYIQRHGADCLTQVL